jgi:cytochrome c biogenesis protein CcdA
LVFGLAFALLELPTCPCCGAVLLAISSVVLAKNLSWYAIIVFISFALGQSFPIFAIGLTTSLIKADLVGTLSHRIHRFEQKLKFMAGNMLILIGVSFLIIA